ncbi:hypothetical protein [Nocardia bovistercoris]|uniref:Uncharacterized protein n=1 Tax=Nocardia bovistercoris TaxID=2785916 RepID=A0A931I6C0_9NOCA|nr:hypothetical protein [Nocardia bovistercoris]MBH0775016.1 hypothetical protein [Nocardia bovistercoris]
MTAPQRLLVARLPTPPTVAPVFPGPSTTEGTAPSSPVAHVDGSRVPVIPAFVSAYFSGTATPTVLFAPSVPTAVTAGGTGLLTVTARYAQSFASNFGDTGFTSARVTGGAGSGIVVSASFGADTRAVGADAALVGFGTLSATAAGHAGALPAYSARGTATASVSSSGP